MRIITYARLRTFGMKNPHVMPSIASWYKIAKSNHVFWEKPQDVVTTFGFGRVDILKNDRVRIDLAGNHVRLILKIEYGSGMAFVRWIGWHKDYDALGNNIHTI